MNNLIAAGRDIVVLGSEPDLIDTSLGAQLAAVSEAIDEVESLIDGTERTIGTTLNQLCWRFPDLSNRFRERYNKFLELRGDTPIRKDRDPSTRKNKDGTTDEEEAARAEREAEEAALEALKNTDDSQLTEAQKRLKLSVRIKREKCRKFYQLVAKKTHPDKVKDAELNSIFIDAKKAYDALDLPKLKEMYKDLQGFLKLRDTKGTFRTYRIRKLQVSKVYLEERKSDFKTLKSGLAFECVKAVQSEDPARIREAYQDYIEEQMIQLDEVIESLRSSMRMQPRTKMPADLKSKLMAGLFD